MRTRKEFREIIQPRIDDLVLEELKYMKRHIAYLKRTRKNDDIYERLLISLADVIILQKGMIEVRK